MPRDEPSDDRKSEGFSGFLRYACKMATGSGKTTVMGMLAAWSILNKVNDRSDGRFSDVVLVVCPNVTIRDRLTELSPERGEASIYRTRDLVPPHLMPLLSQGKVLVTNWHVFEPQGVQTGGVTAKVAKAGVPVRTRETINIGPKTTTARGSRYLTLKDFERQVAAGLLTVLSEEKERDGSLKRVKVESVRYVESDTSLINRVLGREVGGKQNILILNDEAHHAYRIKRDEPEPGEIDDFSEEDEAEDFFQEATVWIEGLDRIHKLRGINFCVDLSATPYFLGRVGQESNKPFPWVVSDFGLVDAIESGLVKIPQMPVARCHRRADTELLQYLELDSAPTYPRREGRNQGQSETGSHSEVCASPRGNSRGSLGKRPGGLARDRDRAAPAGVYYRLQKHEDRQSSL